MLRKRHCVAEGTSTLNLLIPDIKNDLMFCTTYVQTLYREVQVWTVSRLYHATPNNSIKKVCVMEGTENWYTSDLSFLVVKYHATDKT